jgi:hypothetical protein
MGILVNGRDFSYASLEISLLRRGRSSEIFVKIDEVSYSDALEIAFVRGTNRGPLGCTAGVYTPGDASLSMAKADFQTGIVEGIGDGWLGSNLLVLVKYADEGESVITDRLNCRIVGADDSHSHGADNLKTKLGLKPITIERNGIKPVKGMLV